MQGFYFSPINQAMLSTNYADSMNLFWNQQLEASRANSLNFMVPSYNPSVFWEFPQYNMFGDGLLSFDLACKQVTSNWASSIWNWSNPFTQSTPSANGTSGAKTDEEKAAEKTMQERYNKLKAVLTQYQKIANKRKLGTDESRNKLSVAISKSGKLEERYKALQDAYKSINSADLRKAFLSKPEVLNDLNAIGYNFTDRTYHYGNKDKEDATLTSALDKLEQEITQKGSDKDSKQVTSNMVDRAQLYNSDNIMRTISYWNDTHKTDKDRSIVRLMIKNLPSSSTDKATYISNNIQPLSDALTSHANATIDELKSLNVDTTELEKQSKKVKDYFNTKSFANIKAFANDFDKLYAMLRKADALKINKKYVSDYQFLNDISDSDTDFINDQLIVKDTDVDLAKEGLGDIKTEFSVVSDAPASANTPASANAPASVATAADDNTSNNVKVEPSSSSASKTTTESTETTTNGAYYGEKLAELSNGFTYKASEKKITYILNNNINADNITDVISGYYDNKSNSDGIIEQLCGEQGDDAPKIKDIRHIIDSLLEAAEKYDLEGTYEYEMLQEYIDNIGSKEEVSNDSKKYDQDDTWESWALFGKSESEIIDDLVKDLCNNVRIKEDKPAIQENKTPRVPNGYGYTR